MTTPVGKVACAVSATPFLHSQTLRWAAALHLIAGVRLADLLVVTIDDATSPELDYLAAIGVDRRPARAFDRRSPHANKVAALAVLAASAAGTDGLSTLSDCDVAFLVDPRTAPIAPGALGAKQVDLANPPLSRLHPIFAAAHLPAPPAESLDLDPGHWTLRGNCNGGVYVADAPWRHHAAWLCEQQSLLGEWAIHVDQVSMLLALVATGTPYAPLPMSWNYPLHLAGIPVPDALCALHYHDRIDAEGQLLRQGHPHIDAALAQIDAAVAQFRRDGGLPTAVSTPDGDSRCP
jgi:hypothetical protein